MKTDRQSNEWVECVVSRTLVFAAVVILLGCVVVFVAGCRESEPSVTTLAWPADAPCFEDLGPEEQVYLGVAHCRKLGLEPPVRIVPCAFISWDRPPLLPGPHPGGPPGDGVPIQGE
jgi:hypothetical protein